MTFSPRWPRFDPANPSKNWRPAIVATAAHISTGAPNAPGGSPGGFCTSHNGFNGCHFLNMDGSVRIISDNIALGPYRSLATRAGDEIVPPEAF